MDVAAILEGIISAVPEAVELYRKIAPHLTVNPVITDAQAAEIEQLMPTAHAAVDAVHTAVGTIVDQFSKKSSTAV